MLSLNNRRLRRTTIMICGLAAFLVGIAVARVINIDLTWPLLAAILLVTAGRRSTHYVLMCAILLGLTFGIWRGSIYMEKIALYEPLNGQTVVIEGRADSDAVYTNKSQISFDAAKIKIISPVSSDIAGKIAVKGYGPPMVYRSDTIRAEAKLYKTRGSRQASLSFADITVINRGSSWLDGFRRNFLAGLQSALPEPLASFAAGLLIGQRSTLPESTTNDLKSAGLTHVVAVSGYNLTIIIYFVHRLLKNRSKYQATAVSLVCITLFLLITGFSASIVRAAIVSVLAIAAWYYGRQFRPLLLILLAAALTAGWYPVYLWSDIGWYLSFLAFFGVLVIAPLLAQRLYKKKSPSLVGKVVLETLAAQIMALPLIMYIFGEVSLVSLFANVLVVPLVPLAMLLSLAAGLGGMLAPSLAGWLAWPAKLLLTYMLDVVHLFASVPHALADRRLLLSQLLVVYGLIIGLTWILWRKMRSKNAAPQ